MGKSRGEEEKRRADKTRQSKSRQEKIGQEKGREEEGRAVETVCRNHPPAEQQNSRCLGCSNWNGGASSKTSAVGVEGAGDWWHGPDGHPYGPTVAGIWTPRHHTFAGARSWARECCFCCTDPRAGGGSHLRQDRQWCARSSDIEVDFRCRN